MRILCFLNRDLASNLALNLLLRALPEHEVRVGLSEQVGSSSLDEAPERRELRMAEQWLPNQLLFPLVECANRPDHGSRHLTFAEIQRYRGIPIESLPNPNIVPAIDSISSFAPDLIVTVRYGAILKPPVIAIPRLGVLNLHSGLLPQYRGVLATFRALMNEDATIGCTLHYIADASIDTGDIIGVRTVPVSRDASLLRHILALYPPGIALMRAVIEGLAKGDRPRTTKQTGDGAYYSYPTREEWSGFTRRGWRVAEMRDLSDALEPYMGEERVAAC